MDDSKKHNRRLTVVCISEKGTENEFFCHNLQSENIFWRPSNDSVDCDSVKVGVLCPFSIIHQ